MKSHQLHRAVFVALPILLFALPAWSAPRQSVETVPDLTRKIDFERKEKRGQKKGVR